MSFNVYVKWSVCCRNLAVIALASLFMTLAFISSIKEHAGMRGKQIDYLSVWGDCLLLI